MRNVADEPAGDTAILGKPQTTYIALDPRTVRSQFAKFLPENIGGRDLMGGLAAAGILAPATFSERFGDYARGGRVDRKHDVVSLAVESKGKRCIRYVDRHVPKKINIGGKSLDPARPLSAHEDAEKKLMAKGMSYEDAHKKATATEKQWIESHGYNWKHYEHWADGELAHLEHEHVSKPPPNPHIDPKKAIAKQGGGTVEDDLPFAARFPQEEEFARSEKPKPNPYDLLSSIGSGAQDLVSSNYDILKSVSPYMLPSSAMRSLAKALPESKDIFPSAYKPQTILGRLGYHIPEAATMAAAPVRGSLRGTMAALPFLNELVSSAGASELKFAPEPIVKRTESEDERYQKAEEALGPLRTQMQEISRDRSLGPKNKQAQIDAISKLMAPFEKQQEAINSAVTDRQQLATKGWREAKASAEAQRREATTPYEVQYPEEAKKVADYGQGLSAIMALIAGILSRKPGRAWLPYGSVLFGGVEGAGTANYPNVVDWARFKSFPEESQEAWDRTFSKENMRATLGSALKHAGISAGIAAPVTGAMEARERGWQGILNMLNLGRKGEAETVARKMPWTPKGPYKQAKDGSWYEESSGKKIPRNLWPSGPPLTMTGDQAGGRVGYQEGGSVDTFANRFEGLPELPEYDLGNLQARQAELHDMSDRNLQALREKRARGDQVGSIQHINAIERAGTELDALDQRMEKARAIAALRSAPPASTLPSAAPSAATPESKIPWWVGPAAGGAGLLGLLALRRGRPDPTMLRQLADLRSQLALAQSQIPVRGPLGQWISKAGKVKPPARPHIGELPPSVGGFAYGGQVPWYVRQQSRDLSRDAMMDGHTPGRADKLPINVKSGSYVIPADVVSGMGQGNSKAGSTILSKMFKTLRPRLGFADGGGVPIAISDGEFLVSPESVQSVGSGDMDRGHAILDAFVKKVRKDYIGQLKDLKPPKKN